MDIESFINPSPQDIDHLRKMVEQRESELVRLRDILKLVDPSPSPLKGRMRMRPRKSKEERRMEMAKILNGSTMKARELAAKTGFQLQAVYSLANHPWFTTVRGKGFCLTEEGGAAVNGADNEPHQGETT